jgi:hypothetical protein
LETCCPLLPLVLPVALPLLTPLLLYYKGRLSLWQK